jgi:O-antigen/teichoic acid export membrane protein
VNEQATKYRNGCGRLDTASGAVIGSASYASRISDTAKATVTPKISHAVLLTSAQLSRGFSRLFFVLVVARVLGPQQFGVYALLFAIVEMLAVASGSGYADYLTREAAKDPRLGWGLGSQLTWLRLACAFFLACAGLVMLWLFGYPRMVLLAAAWLSVSLAPRSVSEAVQGVLRGVGRYVAYLVVELVFDLTLLGGVVFILAWGGGLRVVIATEVIAATTMSAASIVFMLMFRTKDRVGLHIKQLLKKSSIFNISAFVCNLYDRVDIVLLSKLAGDYATGVYSAAYRPLGTVQLVPYGVLYSLLPGLSRNAESREELSRLEKAMGFLLSAAFVVVLATMVFAGPAVHLLLGERYAESAAALKILIWAVILRYVNFALNTRLLAAGREKVFVVTSMVCLAVNVVANVVFIPMFSWRAAAATTILTELVLLGQNVYWLRRTVGSIPRPFGWVRSSLVFSALLVVSLVGARVVSLLWIGSACVLFFLAYLYRSGMIGEFATAWRRSGAT